MEKIIQKILIKQREYLTKLKMNARYNTNDNLFLHKTSNKAKLEIQIAKDKLELITDISKKLTVKNSPNSEY